MEPTAKLQFVDRGVVLDETLVLTDMHLGRGRAGGLQLPLGGSADMLDRFGTLIAEVGAERVVIAGDLLHSFNTIPRPVRRTIEGLRDRAAGTEIVITRGNHDTQLDAVWDGPIKAAVEIDGTVICHGHREPDIAGDRYIIGHDHPTLAVDGRRHPCALVGSDAFRGAPVIMLPAFNRLLRGVAVNDLDANDLLSPLVSSLEEVTPVVFDPQTGDTHRFPALGAPGLNW